jgi:exodeoxyribonuclease V gamma subunit
MAVHVYESVSFDCLWARFAQDIAVPPATPLAPELVVVPGTGWESWFTRRLATERGCWAHHEFVALGRWLSRTLVQVLGSQQAQDREVDAMAWAIAAKLPALLDNDGFAAVRGYLQAGGDGADVRRLVDLSRCIAAMFDQLRLSRPQLIAAWEAGIDWPPDAGPVPEHAVWQRRLWTEITRALPLRSVDALLKDLDRVLDARAGLMPERAGVWMCGGVPRAHLDFLELAGRHCEIRLYALTPSYAYWADMQGRRQLLRRLRDSDASLRDFCEQQHLEPLHPLLASMGQLSQDRQIQFVDRDAHPWQFKDLEGTVTAGSQHDTLLASLQRALHAAGEPEPAELSADASLSIHSCHSAMREVEVLREQIRDALETDPSLQPEEVVVLCPDLETYAPLVQAVFGLPEPGLPGAIPFNIAGRSPRRTRPIVDAYFQLLDVVQGRFGAGEVLDLLNAESVAEAAGLDDDDVQQATGWVTDSGVRWGLDGEQRREEGLPASDLNTWQFGFDRLFLGYVMPPGGGQLVGDVVALDRVEGLAAATLGKLWSFVQQLGRWRRQLRGHRPWEQWRRPLGQLADQMLAVRRDEAGAQFILDAMDRLVKVAVEGGFDRPVPLALVAKELARQVDESAGGSAFRMGGVTFCETAAMRSLPFGVIALLGMNDGSFPRVDRPAGFDLMSLAPQRGDRSVRLEDKHVFLEALLSARQRLIITCQGQRLSDRRSRPPSIVVEELLDALESADSGTEKQRRSLRARLVVEHPLHAFSPRYFTGQDQRLFSYEQSKWRAAEALGALRVPAPCFAACPLPVETDVAEVGVQDLRTLVERPWELFLRRLGASLRDDLQASDDSQPLLLDELESWTVGDAWVQCRLAGEPPDAIVARIRRSGGRLGASTLDAVRRKAERVLEAAEARGIGAGAESKSVRIDLGGVLVAGRVHGCTDDGVRRAVYSSLGLKWKLRLWLDHLLSSAVAGHTEAHAILVGRDGCDHVFDIPPVARVDALAHLQRLLDLVLLARRMPLPFFCDSAEAVSRLTERIDLNCDAGAQHALAAARPAYERRHVGAPVAHLPSVQAVFAGLDPFELTCARTPGFEDSGSMPLFVRLFQVICQPMFDTVAGA